MSTGLVRPADQAIAVIGQRQSEGSEPRNRFSVRIVTGRTLMAFLGHVLSQRLLGCLGLPTKSVQFEFGRVTRDEIQACSPGVGARSSASRDDIPNTHI